MVDIYYDFCFIIGFLVGALAITVIWIIAILSAGGKL